MHRIEGDTAGFFARGDRPVRDDFVLRRVDRNDFALVFDIAVDTPRGAVDRREFRIASERNGADDFRRRASITVAELPV